MYNLYICVLGVNILPLDWPCKITEVYKAPRFWRRVYYSKKNGVPAVNQKSAIIKRKMYRTVHVHISYIYMHVADAWYIAFIDMHFMISLCPNYLEKRSTGPKLTLVLNTSAITYTCTTSIFMYYICVFDDQRVSQTAKGNKVTCEVFRLAMHMSTSIITYLKSRHIRLASMHVYLILSVYVASSILLETSADLIWALWVR